jgi:CheY-like chemotaxis protein
LLLESVREAVEQTRRGVAFVCLLQDDSTSIDHTPFPSSSSSSSSMAPSVLLVEDVRVSRDIALHTLRRHGYPNTIAVDKGAAAIDAFHRHAATLDIILMDINLPDMSGTRVTEQIRIIEREHQQQAQDRKPVLIFGLTGNTDAISLESYQQAGMNGCIAKGNSHLHQAVAQAIEQTRTLEFAIIQ